MKKASLSVVVFLCIGLSTLAAQVPSWQLQSAGAPVPGATPVGHDPQGQSIYLTVLGSQPQRLGYLDPSDPRAWVFFGQSAAQVSNFDTYTGPGRWVAASSDHLPPDAINVGKRSDGNPLYVLRVNSQGWLIPAFYSAAEHAAVSYINGQRLLFSTFEALVPDWAKIGSDQASNAFHAANDSDGSPMAPMRDVFNRVAMLGKYNMGTHQAYYPQNGREIEDHSPSAELFIGSGVWKGFDGHLPSGAIPAGMGNDGSIVYMIRATVPGTSAQSLGYMQATDHAAFVSYGGRAFQVSNFEVLSYDTQAQVPESVAMTSSVPGQTPPSTSPPMTTQTVIVQAAPQPLQDRTVAPTEIQTQYGYARMDGQLSVSSGIKNGTYVDTYVYKAKKGEKFQLDMNPAKGARGGYFVDRITDPSGNQVNLDSRGEARELKVGSAQAGNYTLSIAAADPANLASY
ncbi:MAG TPA: DM9 repeat-containing protein, partial [Spirochaetia bacterium]|nr:DM9 repeat-containing protein [Spirochaetia bacterium]